MNDLLTRLVPELFPGSAVVGEIVPLHGGLESSVARLTIAGPIKEQIVVKQLDGAGRREASRYRLLAGEGLTPRLIGVADRDERTYLFVESVQGERTWPWHDSSNTRLVLDQLARVHRLRHFAAQVDDWDYEDDLRRSALATVALAEEIVPLFPEMRRDLRALRRIAESISMLRGHMMRLLGVTLIHGDVHSGNVVLRDANDVVLLDWGRSRAGSPLEDVSSWLLSLRWWEPAAARDHDTLFRAYLAAAGHSSVLTDAVRDAYWVAAASNVLAGALRYHLWVARELSSPSAVAQARHALRIVRRADARLRA
jgi:aminoglycoside phosphotransferase (APT) family kinase protein